MGTRIALTCDGSGDPAGLSDGCGYQWVVEDESDSRILECPNCGSIYPQWEYTNDDT